MGRKANDAIRTNIYLAKPQHEALHALAEHTGITFTEHARRAVDFYLAFSDDVHKAVDRVRELDNPTNPG